MYVEIFVNINAHILPRDPNQIKAPENMDINVLQIVAMRENISNKTLKLFMAGGLILECDISFKPFLRPNINLPKPIL